ncbi:glycosyltransferase [Marisediminicola sp. LYQ134]|uniref:glycosyltransferase n=1 Tax=unclassified Marisediminicola TaxID=2618316 RepID=UPI0039835865
MALSPPDPIGHPRVAVVTVSFGSSSVLGPFLSSIPSAAVTESPLVVVADNRVDESEHLDSLVSRAGARYLPLASNLGYGGAVNAATRELPSSVDWILVSNPDVVLGEGAIDILVREGDADETVGAIGPAVLTGVEGAVYPSARSVPSLRTGIGHALFANLWPSNPWSRAYRRDSDDTPLRRDAGWLSGACLLVRRRVFDDLGGFDPSFFMYFEDVDLGYRIGKAGYRNVYEPSATAVHTGAHSTTTDSQRMIDAHHESARQFMHKKYPGALLWPVRAALTVGLRVRAAVVGRRTFGEPHH